MKIIESQLINKYLKPLTFNNKNSLNLKDDIYYDIKKKIIVSTDTYEEKIHFNGGNNPNNFLIKIFRSAISDIYAKGCKPFVYFLNISINKTNINWLKNFNNILKKESKLHNIFLGGGDTVKSKKLSITITTLGNIKKKPVLRSGAKLSDDIYVTGTLGDSYIGLLCILNKLKIGNFKKYFIKRFKEPLLHPKFSMELHRFASSSTDISDGIIKDIKNICNSSNKGAKLFYAKIPFSKNALTLQKNNKINLINVFSQGDDYQILFTSNKKNRNLIRNISKITNTRVSRVGKITANKKVEIRNSDKIIDLSAYKTGYIHEFS
jgi:thiamine-monophosphate kinase